MCATIRWSGRTLRFSMPGATEDLRRLGYAKPPVIERLAKLRSLIDGRQVRQKDPSRTQRRGGVLNDLPGLRHVEHDPIEPGLFDSLGDVPDLDGVVDVLSEHRHHVLAGVDREVLADLVAQQGDAGPQQRHRERPRSNPRLENSHSGSDVSGDQDGAKILGVDDLSSTGHLDHHVGQRRSEDEEVPAGRSSNDVALV